MREAERGGCIERCSEVRPPHVRAESTKEGNGVLRPQILRGRVEGALQPLMREQIVGSRSVQRVLLVVKRVSAASNEWRWLADLGEALCEEVDEGRRTSLGYGRAWILDDAEHGTH